MKPLKFIAISTFIHLTLLALALAAYFNSTSKSLNSKIKNEVIFVLKRPLENQNQLEENSKAERSHPVKSDKKKILVSNTKIVKSKSKSLNSNLNIALQSANKIQVNTDQDDENSQYDRITLSENTITNLLSRNQVPLYPRVARVRKKEGQVILRAVLDEGTIHNGGPAKSVVIHLSSGHSILDDSALSAVKEWYFPESSLKQLRGGAGKKSLLIPIRFALKKSASSVENN